MSDYARFTKCAAIPGWQIAVELFDYGTQMGVAIWDGKEGGKRHAVRADSFKEAISTLKGWVGA